MLPEGTDYQMNVWKSVPFAMPSMHNCQYLQSTYEKNFKSFLSSAFLTPSNNWKQKVLGRVHVEQPYLEYKEKGKSSSDFLQLAFSNPKY